MRALTEIETRILGMIEPAATALGLDIVRVRVTGGQRPVLQVMTERPDGTVSVEDCAKLSRRISPTLDEQDPISSEYQLEVSSPGIDRPLTRKGDFTKWIGHEAKIEVGFPVEGRKRFHGFIVSEAADGAVALNLKDGGTATIPFAEMVKAHLVLTDALIDAVTAEGLVPGDIDEEEFDEDFDDVEVDDTGDDDGEPDAEDAISKERE